MLLSKMFYGHAMFTGGNSLKGSRYLSFPVYHCCVPWIQKLTSIWTTLYTLSLISISSVKKNSPANVLKHTQTWSQLRSMNAKAGEYRRSELRGLDVTISARCHWSIANNWPLFHYVIGILPYNRNVTLQALELFSAYARLYNAAASPTSRLRSAGSLAIIYRDILFCCSISTIVTLLLWLVILCNMNSLSTEKGS